MNIEHAIRLALPGKGTLEAATLAFLAECGMKVNRSNPRQYLARIGSMPGLEVVFQRAADVPVLIYGTWQATTRRIKGVCCVLQQSTQH